jgi:ABC-type nickel/cobalt efflux system permease component RcnA
MGCILWCVCGTLFLHSTYTCYNVVPLLLHCWYTVVTLLLHTHTHTHAHTHKHKQKQKQKHTHTHTHTHIHTHTHTHTLQAAALVSWTDIQTRFSHVLSTTMGIPSSQVRCTCVFVFVFVCVCVMMISNYSPRCYPYIKGRYHAHA